MAYGFKIVDDKHTRTETDIGYTVIGTDSFTGTGTYKFTFPLELSPDYIVTWQYQITDAPTADTTEPVYHLNVVPYIAVSFKGTVTNTSGVCIVNGDFNSSITTPSACNGTSGGVWDTTTPYFAYFEGNVDYVLIGKDDTDSCFSGTNTFTDLKDDTEITMYFLAVGGV
jgi:hypothetical protein